MEREPQPGEAAPLGADLLRGEGPVEHGGPDPARPGQKGERRVTARGELPREAHLRLQRGEETSRLPSGKTEHRAQDRPEEPGGLGGGQSEGLHHARSGEAEY